MFAELSTNDFLHLAAGFSSVDSPRSLLQIHRQGPQLSRHKDTPEPRAVQLPSDGQIVAIPEVGGLHHRYEQRAA